MPIHSLCLLPDDPLIDGVFRYLEPKQLIRLRLTCMRFCALTHLRSVWLSALEKLRREHHLPLPYPARPLSSLTAGEIESSVVKMVRLDDRFTRHRAKPALIRMFSMKGTTPRFAGMHLMAGGEWLLTANSEEVMCWDLSSPDSAFPAVYKLEPVSVSGKDQGYKDICVRNLQAQIHANGDEAVVAAYMSYDGHSTNVWNDKIAVWKISGLLRKAKLSSTFVTSLCFPDYAPEYGMSDLSGDWVAFLGREHETPVISVTNWRTGDVNEYDQAKFRPDLSPVIPEGEPIRVQGIKLVPPHVLVIAGPVIAFFSIPPFDRVKHLCDDAPRLKPAQIHRFDMRPHTLMGDFVGFAQNAAIASESPATYPITLLTSRARITLFPAKSDGEEQEFLYTLPPTISRIRSWSYRTSKPVVIGPSGTRGVWIQRPTGVAPRLIAWTAVREDEEEGIEESCQDEAQEKEVVPSEPGQMIREENATEEAERLETRGRRRRQWPPSGEPEVMQGWTELPCGRARKVDMYPVKIDDVKRIAFDEGTGRICLGMRNGEVHVLDFA